MKYFNNIKSSNKYSMMFKTAIILFIINMILPKNVFAQDKQMMELEPDKELVINLQKLMKRIKKKQIL